MLSFGIISLNPVNTHCFVLHFTPGLSYETQAFKYQLLFAYYIIFLCPLINICVILVHRIMHKFLPSHANVLKMYATFGWMTSCRGCSDNASPVWKLSADALGDQLRVYCQGQNCPLCHLLCLTFKMMKCRKSDPWQDLFKEQPLGNGGSRAWQHAGGLISPLLKGQIEKA